jgi:hypothetical protein
MASNNDTHGSVAHVLKAGPTRIFLVNMVVGFVHLLNPTVLLNLRVCTMLTKLLHWL